MLKICCKCKQEKSVTDFYKRGKSYQSWCKDCANERHKEYYISHHDYYKDKRQKTRKLKSDWLSHLKSTLKCSKCDENHPATLQFHHVDPSQKELSIADMMKRGFSKDKILDEINKCITLCANCHFKEHYKG